MTVEKSSIESLPQGGSGWYKRVFAWIMAHGATEYESAVSDRKQALFANNVHGDVLEMVLEPVPTCPTIHRIFTGLGLMNPYMHSYLKKEADRLV